MKTRDIMIKGQIIDMVDVTKFLGVHIDACLSWRHHIQNTRNKIAKGLGKICKARKVLQKSTLLTLYNSFILPYLTYCIEIWGMTFKCHIDPLFKLQKKALRLITHSHRLAHTESLLKQLNILTIEKLYVFSVQLFMFKFSNAVLPAVFSDFFVVNADVHDHNTRQHLQYHTPIVHSQQTSRRVRVTGVRAHHIFSSIIGYSCSIGQYKISIKRHLIFHDVCLKWPLDDVIWGLGSMRPVSGARMGNYIPVNYGVWLLIPPLNACFWGRGGGGSIGTSVFGRRFNSVLLIHLLFLPQWKLVFF